MISKAQLRRIELYAAKFAAETISAEPSVYVLPTINNIRQCLGNCVRTPSENELRLIRKYFRKHYLSKKGN